MKKIAFSIVGVVVLVAIVFGGVIYYKNNIELGTIDKYGEETETSSTVQVVETAQVVQSAAGASVDKVNPFSADVNPLSGYKNPFQ